MATRLTGEARLNVLKTLQGLIAVLSHRRLRIDGIVGEKTFDAYNSLGTVGKNTVSFYANSSGIDFNAEYSTYQYRNTLKKPVPKAKPSAHLASSSKGWTKSSSSDQLLRVSGGATGDHPNPPYDSTAKVASLIVHLAERYGVHPKSMLAVSRVEAGPDLNPYRKNPNSSAKGLFQFINSTWRVWGNGGDVMDPYANADAAIRYNYANAQGLRKVLGRDPTPGEVYLAHQQGLGGARALLSNPNKLAVNVVSRKAISLNLTKDSGLAASSATARQFTNYWVNRVNKDTGNVSFFTGKRVTEMA